MGSGLVAKTAWVFGTDPDVNNVASEGNRIHGKHNNVVGSSGAGLAYNCHGLGNRYTFTFETTDSNWAYAWQVSRTATGPWTSISSGSGISTSAAPDVLQLPGPFRHIRPYAKAMASTANTIIMTLTAVD